MIDGEGDKSMQEDEVTAKGREQSEIEKLLASCYIKKMIKLSWPSSLFCELL